MMQQYALLCAFVLTFSLVYTLIAYCVSNNPWVSTFVTAAGGLLFLLENMELNKTIKDLEQESETLKKSAHLTLIPKINDLQDEIQQLKACIANQTVASAAKRLKRHCRSSSSL